MPVALAMHSPVGCARQRADLRSKLHPSFWVRRPWGKPISIPRARRGWCVWCPSEGCRTFSTASSIPCGMLWKIAQVGQSAFGEPRARRAFLRLYKTLFQPIFLAISGFAGSTFPLPCAVRIKNGAFQPGYCCLKASFTTRQSSSGLLYLTFA